MRWHSGQKLRVLLALSILIGVEAAPRAHDLERTTVHLTLAPSGAFTLRLAHDPAWLLLRMQSFAHAIPGSSADQAARDRQLRELAPSAIDRVVLFVDGREIRPVSVEYEPPPASAPAGQFALAAYILRGEMPPAARQLRWYYGMVVEPYPLTLTLADGSAVTEWVQGDAWSTSLPLGGPFAPASPWRRVRPYLALGYTHILPGGLDHLLFVLGLFLLRARLGPPIVQVTAFSVAHALTLGLSLYGIVSLPARGVEPLMALSIVYIAIENVWTERPTRWRLAVVLLCGLLHGLGFATVLSNLSLQRADVAAALVGVNGGVELGQLTVIAGAALIVGGWRQCDWYRGRVVVPASIAIGCAGLYWTVLRLS